MGCAISWLAVSGKSIAEIHESLGLSSTGERRARSEGPINGALLSTGWYLICIDDFDHALVSSTVLERLSKGCRVVMCQVEEHVMYSGATLYEDGRQTWRVEHSGDIDTRDLQCEGEVPAMFERLALAISVRQDLADAWRENVDHYFECPLELARQLTGYSYDDAPDTVGDLPFEILEMNEPPSPSLWERLRRFRW